MPWSGLRISEALRSTTSACSDCVAALRRCTSTRSRPSPQRMARRRYKWNRDCRTTACSRRRAGCAAADNRPLDIEEEARMTPEENKAIVRRFFEDVWNKQKLEVVD